MLGDNRNRSLRAGGVFGLVELGGRAAVGCCLFRSDDFFDSLTGSSVWEPWPIDVEAHWGKNSERNVPGSAIEADVKPDRGSAVTDGLRQAKSTVLVAKFGIAAVNRRDHVGSERKRRVANVAVPLTSGAVPSTIVPFKNVTVPVGWSSWISKAETRCGESDCLADDRGV